MRGSGVKESQVGSSRVRYSVRGNVLLAELVAAIAAHDLPALSRSLAHNARIARVSRTVLDLRAAKDEGGRAFRDALTEWAVSGDLPLVMVVSDEMHVAEINMASLARGSLVRAFDSSMEAFRHASRSPSRPSSESGSTGKQPAVGPDERRALLFPRRPSETALPRTPPTGTSRMDLDIRSEAGDVQRDPRARRRS